MGMLNVQIEIGQSFALPFRMMETALPLDMIWVEAGTFYMGSPSNEPNRVAEDEKQFKSTLSQGFWLSKYLVTHAHWQAITQMASDADGSLINYPVTNVNWYEALSYTWELNVHVSDNLPRGYHFGLPTEAMWEYTCRAGTQTRYFWGDLDEQLDNHVWYRHNSSHTVHPIGEKEPNLWGFHDMLGNLEEWCYDSPSDYPDNDTTDWIGRGGGIVRSLRGGNWASLKNENNLRCAGRDWLPPLTRDPLIGFRVYLLPHKLSMQILSSL